MRALPPGKHGGKDGNGGRRPPNHDPATGKFTGGGNFGNKGGGRRKDVVAAMLLQVCEENAIPLLQELVIAGQAALRDVAAKKRVSSTASQLIAFGKSAAAVLVGKLPTVLEFGLPGEDGDQEYSLEIRARRLA
jgi:hypothetical protein